jgi:L-lactate dehydrogenase complex protein LldF
MPSQFRKQIREALANENLQAALDGNAERRASAFESAYKSLPEDLQSMRRRAHAVRTDVIENHPVYLEEFIDQAQQNGFIIHRAQSAEDAVQVVLDISASHSAKTVAKSKSMVSEEIHLNQALAEAGLKVVETDLGEYIIQLRDEPPSHIITPAVHLRREQVADTFEDKLNMPYTQNISELTAAAREKLRGTFLEADIGISGVNFGVAQSGSLCIVTNEGNGRMVTTLPRVHIALMGIERLVPAFDDLALMLYLLPRSATGQKMTVYTSIINGPRKRGELDGAEERHLVLVDNGRSRLRNSPLRECLYCIRCGACLNACPVFREIGGHAYVGDNGRVTTYPGPIGSVVSPGLLGAAQFSHLARASSLCGACKEVCPVDIDLPRLLLMVRAGEIDYQENEPDQATSHNRPQKVPLSLNFGLRLFSWAAVSPTRFAAVQRLAGFSARLVFPRSEWMRLPGITGWGYGRDFPRPASKPFRDVYHQKSDQPGGNGVETVAVQIADKRDNTGNISSGQGSPNSTVPTEDLIQRFASELEELQGSFILCNENDVAGQVSSILKERHIERLQVWDEREFQAGLLDGLRSEGILIQSAPHPDIRAGLTGVDAAVAESGTLLLASGAGRPQTSSLLPEVHIAILRKGDIYENLPQVLALRETSDASYVSMISGPSRTADIEMTLTIGVHGPGEVHVICF